MLRIGVALVLAVLAAATAYEALVALRFVDLGSEPGAGPAGGGPVFGAAMLGILAGAITAIWPSVPERATVLVQLLAPAAAAFLVARFYTFDPYYLPTLRRMSDGGLVSPVLVYLLVALAVLAALLVRVRPRIGLPAAALVMLACGFFAWVAPGGH